MTDAIHERLRDWLTAAANGSLSAVERADLAQHLAECASCRRQASEPALVEELQRLMERHRQIPAGLEEGVLARLRTGAERPAREPVLPGRSPWWLAARIGLAIMVIGLLAVRTLDLRWSPGSGWANRVWVTISQYVLRQPAYPPAEFGAGEEGLLASCHQLASQLVGALLWIGLLVLAGQLLVELWRRRQRLPASLPQTVPPRT